MFMQARVFTGNVCRHTHTYVVKKVNEEKRVEKVDWVFGREPAHEMSIFFWRLFPGSFLFFRLSSRYFLHLITLTAGRISPEDLDIEGNFGSEYHFHADQDLVPMIQGLESEIPQQKGQHDLHLRHCEPLTDAVTWTCGSQAGVL